MIWNRQIYVGCRENGVVVIRRDDVQSEDPIVSYGDWVLLAFQAFLVMTVKTEISEEQCERLRELLEDA